MTRPSVHIFLLIAFSLLFAGNSWAQLDREGLLIDIARQNDYTYSLAFDTWKRYQKGKYSLDLRLGHNSIYNSSLDQDRFVQIYLRSSIWQRYAWKPKLSLLNWIETDQYFNNRNEKVSLYLGVGYQPFSFLSVSPLLGYAFDTRTAILGQTEAKARTNHGITPALLVRAHHVWDEWALETKTDIFLRYKDITPRQQLNFVFQHGWAKEFQEGVTILAGLNGGTHELDDFQGLAVKRIISDSLSPYFNLRYLFSDRWEWFSENSFLLFRRQFKFKGIEGAVPDENDLTFNGMEASTTQRIQYAAPKFRTSGTYTFQYSSRVYDLANSTGMSEAQYENNQLLEKQKDFQKNFHRTEFMVDLRPVKRHQLVGRLVSQYLQYDTQSDQNFDDRDELSYLGNIEWDGLWHRNWRTVCAVSANYRHYAFLFKEKSKENYVQRSLRMDFKYDWRPMPKLRVEGENAVYVTYNVKDYADFNKTDRSTRNLETNLKASYQPKRNLSIISSFRRKETHQSYLNWAAFTETTLDTNTITIIEHKYRYEWRSHTVLNGWFMEWGYKHFEQSKRLKATMLGLDNLSKPISLRQISDQTGPTFSLGFRGKNQATLDATIWAQFQIRRHRYDLLDETRFYPNVFQEEALIEPTVIVRPYFTIKAAFFFAGQEPHQL